MRGRWKGGRKGRGKGVIEGEGGRGGEGGREHGNRSEQSTNLA